jgi:putative FmdB family regulatory protein
MPLFTFKCKSCKCMLEKLLKDDTQPISCGCGSVDLERVFGKVKAGAVWRGAKDHLENVINPEVDRISKNIGKDDSMFLDVCGES